MNKTAQLYKAAKTLQPFINEGQLIVMVEGATCGEEKEYFIEKIHEYAKRIDEMPHSYQTDGQGKNAIAHLHYFLGGCNWYITEKDMGCDTDEIKGVQHQAFGLADLGMGYPELGYISIDEIIKNGGEFDLHWTPKALKDIPEK